MPATEQVPVSIGPSPRGHSLHACHSLWHGREVFAWELANEPQTRVFYERNASLPVCTELPTRFALWSTCQMQAVCCVG